MKTHFFKYPFVLVAATATVLAGILHATTIAVEHSSVPPEFWFFIVAGLMQIVWGINFFYHRTPNMYFVGSVLNLGLTFFWLAARLMPAPFVDNPETIEMIGVITAIIQIVAFIASFWALYRFHRTTIISILALITLSVVLGGIGYTTAKMSEDSFLKLWPEINETPHGHGNESASHNDKEMIVEVHDDTGKDIGHID